LTKISAIIPAYNERSRIGNIVQRTSSFVDEIVVIDDCSSDKTCEIAFKAGARVIRNQKNLGYLNSIKLGLNIASGEVLVTLDADGEHNPEDIPKLVSPILNDEADLVFGKREKIYRFSERFLNGLASIKVGIQDSGSGFRAIKKNLAKRLGLNGRCTCGILALEANFLGARIIEIPIAKGAASGKRKIAWQHALQLVFVIKWLIKSRQKS
jgi:glycosyltransferase involved in cell wall biosynthesis